MGMYDIEGWHPDCRKQPLSLTAVGFVSRLITTKAKYR